MFNLGDQVELDDDFEGTIQVAGWDTDEFSGVVFEVVSIEEFKNVNPKIANIVAKGRTKDDIILKAVTPGYEDKPFAMRPIKALALVEAAVVCRCPIIRLMRVGHYTGCVEATVKT